MMDLGNDVADATDISSKVVDSDKAQCICHWLLRLIVVLKYNRL